MFHSLLLFVSLALQSLIPDQNVQGWTTLELQLANTGKDAVYLNNTEKETLLYLNLARLYPRRYALLEVPKDILLARGEKAKWQSYRQSLLKELNDMQPVVALTPDSMMTINAKCFAKESGEMGKIGHQREWCPKENFSECNAYGVENGREIIMHLLIDHNVPNVAHRHAMLASIFTKTGLGYSKHVKYRHCLVLVMQ